MTFNLTFTQFIKVATGSDEVQVGNSLESCTRASKVVRCRNPFHDFDVSLIDTPGFDDTFRTDMEILRGIADWLEKTLVIPPLSQFLITKTCNRYQRGIQLSGILYLHRITDNRVPNSFLRNIELLRRLCGDDAFSNIRFVTTHWDLLTDQSEGERGEKELCSKYWDYFIEGGSQVFRFQNTHPSAWKIISSLPMEGKATLIQKEMVDQLKPLSRTTAAESLFTWASKALRELITRLESLIRIFMSSIPSRDKSQNESYEILIKEGSCRIDRFRSYGSRLRSWSDSIRSFNSSDESMESLDSDTSHSLLRSRILQRVEESLSLSQRRKLEPKVTRTMTDSNATYLDPVRLGSATLCDIPDMNSLFEMAIEADPTATVTLTGTFQALILARATAPSLSIPGLTSAVGSALRVAELLNVSGWMISLNYQVA